MALPLVLMKQLQPFPDTSEIYNPLSLSLLLLILLLTLVHLLKLSRSSNKLNLPPSPPRLPIIGNLHQILQNVPHRSLKALSDRYGPIMLVYFGNSPSLVVSSAEVASEMMKTHDIAFSNRPRSIATKILLYDGKDLGFAEYGEYWRQLRKICVLELLSNKRVKSAQHIRVEEVSCLINKIRRSCINVHGRSTINLSEMILAVSNNIASRCIFGRKVEDEEEENGSGESKFGELTKKYPILLASTCVGDLYPSLKWIDFLTGSIGHLHKTARDLGDLVDQVIEEHRITLTDDDKKDFIHVLLQLQKDGNDGIEVTQDTLKAILMDMFVAGTDTAATTLEWMMAELLKNPSIMKRAQKEVRGVVKGKLVIDMKDLDQMEYLKCVIKESLRLHASAPLLLPRETRECVKLRGYDIPAKTRVFVNAWAIQRDPKLWDRPKEFLPERFENSPIDYKGQDFQFIPFGSGRRSCPGISFAVTAVEYVIANILYWFDWKLPDGPVEENLDMSEATGLTLQRKSPLLVVPTVYSP
ncbi:cytochrome P450 71A22 [Citrus sinensis]|uniref:Cytochrome P450 71A22 n=2 Tax=Citrus sinensis TaxID=2711 RepID=A0ACB8NA30_CITSI|nr:cytochrome P450 71A22 [Citrus sinensis]